MKFHAQLLEPLNDLSVSKARKRAHQLAMISG
jgi:hypothetical protein